MNKALIKAIKKETASLLASLFFYRFGSGHFTNARERRSREIGAYTIDLLSQDNVVSKRKIPRNRKVSGVFLYSKKRIVRKFIRLEIAKHLSVR